MNSSSVPRRSVNAPKVSFAKVGTAIDSSFANTRRRARSIGVVIAFLVLAVITVITIVYWKTDSQTDRIGVGIVVLILQLVQFGVIFAYGYSKKHKFDDGQKAKLQNTIMQTIIEELDANNMIKIAESIKEEEERKVKLNSIIGLSPEQKEILIQESDKKISELLAKKNELISSNRAKTEQPTPSVETTTSVESA